MGNLIVEVYRPFHALACALRPSTIRIARQELEVSDDIKRFRSDTGPMTATKSLLLDAVNQREARIVAMETNAYAQISQQRRHNSPYSLTAGSPLPTTLKGVA